MRKYDRIEIRNILCPLICIRTEIKQRWRGDESNRERSERIRNRIELKSSKNKIRGRKER